MSQDERETPGSPHGDASGEPPTNTFKRRVWNWLKDSGFFFGISAPIAYVFEHYVSQERLEDLIAANKSLYDAVAGLSRLGLIYHLLDFNSTLLWELRHALNFVFPMWLMDQATPVLLLFTGAITLGLSPMLLPILVFMNGNLLEGALVILVFLPLLVAVPQRGLAGVLIALALTIAFFGAVQVFMLGSLFVLGKVLHSVSTLTASSTIASAVYWRASKRAEHSISERVVERARHAITG